MSNDLVLRPPDTRAERRRVTLTDRLALRIGISLVIWSRRPRRTRMDPALRVRLEREREQREAEWLALGSATRAWR